MELQEILSVALGTLIVIVIAHFAVFWVVRTMYPPPPSVVYMPAPASIVTSTPTGLSTTPVETFTSPALPEQQNVSVPTYPTSVQVEAPREERRPGPPPPEDTSIRGNPGAAAPNA
jgi:hypothetical protein